MHNGPVYIRIAEDIKAKIFRGELKAEDAIASEANLCKEYGASRMTVRKGLTILAHEGYIYSVPGKGNFVQKPKYNKYTVYYDEMSNLINSVDKTKLLNVNIVVPDENLCNALQITKNKSVIVIDRLLYTDEEPVAYDLKYLIYQKGMPLVEKEIESARFTELFHKGLPLYPLKTEMTIYAKVPDDKLKKYLNIYSEVALMVVEQKLYNNEEKPIGMGITYFLSDYIKLQGFSQK